MQLIFISLFVDCMYSIIILYNIHTQFIIAEDMTNSHSTVTVVSSWIKAVCTAQCHAGCIQ